MMSSGYDMPDDYIWLPGSARFPVSDIGELASRLGSPVKYDRRGEVIWFDDVRNGLAGYQLTKQGTGASVDVSCDYGFSSGYSLRITPGLDGVALAGVRRQFAPFHAERTGLEVALSFVLGCNYMLIVLYRRSGTIRYEGVIKLDLTNDEILIKNKAGAYVKVDDKDYYVGTLGGFHIVKLVCDFLNNIYIRLLFDDVSYDISGFELYQAADTAAPSYLVECLVYGNVGFNNNVYLNHLIITANES